MAEWTKDPVKELNHIFSRLDTGTAHPSTPDSPARWEPVHHHQFQARCLPLCSPRPKGQCAWLSYNPCWSVIGLKGQLCSTGTKLPATLITPLNSASHLHTFTHSQLFVKCKETSLYKTGHWGKELAWFCTTKCSVKIFFQSVRLHAQLSRITAIVRLRYSTRQLQLSEYACRWENRVIRPKHVIPRYNRRRCTHFN